MLIPPADAIREVLEGATRLGTERIAVAQADGRVLARDLVAKTPLPRFSHSSMDGYAVRLADLPEKQGPSGSWSLPVAGESRAGEPLEQLQAGSCCRIFTGAQLPTGADAVIMQEDVQREGDRIHCSERPQTGHFVRRQGEDLAAGEVALREGLRLSPAGMGLAASLDYPHIDVATAPRVCLMSTGDELRQPGEPDRPGAVIESNGMTLAALTRRIGGSPTLLPFVADTREATEKAMTAALASHDLVVTIGGASVGDHDHVRAAAEASRVTLAFWGVAVKPGKPVGFGRKGGARLLCLPGNPASATVSFLLFGAPLLRALQGESSPLPRREALPIRGGYEKRTTRTELLRARLHAGPEGRTEAHLASSQSSGAVTSFATADAIVVLAPETTEVRDGQAHPVIRIADMIG